MTVKMVYLMAKRARFKVLALIKAPFSLSVLRSYLYGFRSNRNAAFTRKRKATLYFVLNSVALDYFRIYKLYKTVADIISSNNLKSFASKLSTGRLTFRSIGSSFTLICLIPIFFTS